MATDGWEQTRWWRAIGPDGDLWCESSNEAEVRDRARPDDTIQSLWQQTGREWRPTLVTPPLRISCTECGERFDAGSEADHTHDCKAAEPVDLDGLLEEHGWWLDTHGDFGSLWTRGGGDIIGLPYDLTPEHWEWPHVVARITTPTKERASTNG